MKFSCTTKLFRYNNEMIQISGKDNNCSGRAYSAGDEVKAVALRQCSGDVI